MPSHYRGIDDDGPLWGIQIENSSSSFSSSSSRPSKRQRTALLELELGLELEPQRHGFSDCLDEAVPPPRATDGFASQLQSQFHCQCQCQSHCQCQSQSDSDSIMNVDEEAAEEESVECILHECGLFSGNEGHRDDIDLLQKGLDKLWKKTGPNNKNHVSRQEDRLQLLRSGGHWMLTRLLSTLVARQNQKQQQQQQQHQQQQQQTDQSLLRDNHSHSHSACDMDTGFGTDYGVGVVTPSPAATASATATASASAVEPWVAASVIRSCQILGELLRTIDPSSNNSNSSSNNSNDGNGSARVAREWTSATARYQVYCAGGLDAAVAVLEAFPSRFDVQLAGCEFLSRLVSSPSGGERNASASANANANASASANTSANASASASANTNAKNGDGDGDGVRPGSGGSIDNPQQRHPSKALLQNFYRSTHGLKLVLRLLLCGSGSGTGSSRIHGNRRGNRRGHGGGGDRIIGGDTELWQLYFAVTNMVRSVVRHSPDRKPELLRTVHELLRLPLPPVVASPEPNGMLAMDEGDDDNDDDDSGDANPFCRSQRFGMLRDGVHGGLAKHLYEHLVTILVEE